MINHLVFFKLKNPHHGLEETIIALKSLKSEIKEIKEFKIGKNISDEDATYDIALYSTFETVKDLLLYRNHPKHQFFVKNYANIFCEHAKIVDFES